MKQFLSNIGCPKNRSSFLDFVLHPKNRLRIFQHCVNYFGEPSVPSMKLVAMWLKFPVLWVAVGSSTLRQQSHLFRLGPGACC